MDSYITSISWIQKSPKKCTKNLWESIHNLKPVEDKALVNTIVELKEFMDSHPEGVVYVSFGTQFKANAMTTNQKTIY